MPENNAENNAEDRRGNLGYLLVVEQECHASMLEALRPSMARLVSLSAPVVEMAIADVKCLLSRRMRSIEEALAYGRAAEARNAICRADLALELVVIRKLVVCREIESVRKKELFRSLGQNLPLAMFLRA